MGIRFRCHHCEHELHVKDFQAGKKGRCPRCEERILIPAKDAEHSLAIESASKNRVEQSIVEAAGKVAQNAQVAEKVAANSQEVEKAAIGKSSSQNTATLAGTEGSIAKDTSRNPDASEAAGVDDVTPASIPPVAKTPEEQLQPKAIVESGTSTWYVMPPSGGQFGPAPAETMMQWLIERRVTADSLVWREGWEEWQPAAKVFADYFGSAADESTSLKHVVAPAGINSESPGDGKPFQTGGIGDKKRTARKQKKRKRYALSVAFLSVITLVLIATLVTVLMMQLKG